MAKDSEDAEKAGEQNEVIITTAALEFMLHAARNTYPDEFAALLRKNKKGQISEVLVIPQTIYGEDFSSINFYNVAYTSGHCGSVHSHPSRDPRPSRADLAFFKASGDTHIIIAYPFTPNALRAYDSKGKALPIKIA